MHTAALADHAPLVVRSLAAGMMPNVFCTSGQTPLMWAAARGKLRAGRALLDVGADPERKDNQGATAFILTAQHQSHTMLLLLASRVDPDRLLRQCDKNGCTAVHWAAYLGNVDGLRLLAYFGGDFCALDQDGCTPLHRVAMNPKLESRKRAQVLRVLLEGKADATARDRKGRVLFDLISQTEQQTLRRITTNSPETLHQALCRLGRFVKVRMFPLVWWCCVLLCVLQFWRMRDTSWALTPLAAALFEVATPLMAVSFLCAACLDPGRVQARTRHSSGVEEVMAVLSGPDGSSSNACFDRLCLTTWVLKGLRTKYCTRTGVCIEEFDHFCVWMNAPIGRGNHRVFVCHNCLQVLVLWVHFFACFRWWYELREAQYKATADIGTLAVAADNPLLALVLVIDVGALVKVGALAWSQISGILSNLTTNERINLHRYKHFWVNELSGQADSGFVNPFDKGSAWLNWMDFWWLRRRQERGPSRTRHCAAAPGWLECVAVRLWARLSKQFRRQRRSEHSPEHSL